MISVVKLLEKNKRYMQFDPGPNIIKLLGAYLGA